MGRSSLILLLSLLALLTVVLPSVHRIATRSEEKYLGYHKVTQAHLIALSGLNTSLQQIFQDKEWRAGFSKVPFAGGMYTATVEDYGTNFVKITSTGLFEDSTQVVSTILQPTSFATYAYYSVVEGSISWASQDTLWGPVHTEDRMKISGSPVFYGQVTTKLGTNPTKSAAKFLGGYQAGVSVPLPTTLAPVVDAASKGGKIFSNTDVWITISRDSLQYRTSASGTATTSSISSLTSNGIVLISNGNLHVSGVLKGKLTLAVTGTGTNGNIYIENDIVYNQDPRKYTNSTDMLGLVCDNKVIVADNAANNSNCTIQASIFCKSAGLTAENYSSRPISGSLSILGGLIQYQRGAVGTLGGSTINHGFQKDYVYDDRFKYNSPPSFPITDKFQVVLWEE